MSKWKGKEWKKLILQWWILITLFFYLMEVIKYERNCIRHTLAQKYKPSQFNWNTEYFLVVQNESDANGQWHKCAGRGLSSQFSRDKRTVSWLYKAVTLKRSIQKAIEMNHILEHKYIQVIMKRRMLIKQKWKQS